MTYPKICNVCGKEIQYDDIWYPFFNDGQCGGGIYYLCARCTIKRVTSDKRDLYERLENAEQDGKYSPPMGLMEFYCQFPISPTQWVRYFAVEEDLEEIKRDLKDI